MKRGKASKGQEMQLPFQFSERAKEPTPPKKADVVPLATKRAANFRDELIQDLIASKVPEKKQGPGK